MGIIRLLLAISVIVEHSTSIFGFKFIGGQLAVEIFFMISGFYMALILTEKYNQKHNYKLFLSNRLLKIFPIYWIILILCFIYEIVNSYIHYPNDIFSFFDPKLHINIFPFIFLIITNITIIGQDVLNFLGINFQTGNFFFTPSFKSLQTPLYDFLLIPQAWTLSLELIFYSMVPFLNKFKTKYLLLIMTFSLIIRIILYNYGYTNDPWSYRFFPNEILFFVGGIITYRIYNYLKSLNIKTKYLKSILIIYLSEIIFYQLIPENITKQPILFISTFIFLPFIFLLTKNFKFDNKIGELSYPVYLCHFLIINIITHFTNLNHNYLGITATILSVLISIILLRFIIKPIDKFRQKRIAVSRV